MWWFILVWYIVASVHAYRTFGDKFRKDSLLDIILLFPLIVTLEFWIMIDIIKYYIKRDKISLERSINNSMLIRIFKRFFKRKDENE